MENKHRREETPAFSLRQYRLGIKTNGIEADIKLVISEEESPYTEGVLFHDGYELTRTDPDDTYDGEWDFECDELKYIVLVETEK